MRDPINVTKEGPVRHAEPAVRPGAHVLQARRCVIR